MLLQIANNMEFFHNEWALSQATHTDDTNFFFLTFFAPPVELSSSLIYSTMPRYSKSKWER